jgi:hypothetical protein
MFGIAHIKLNIIEILNGHEILFGHERLSFKQSMARASRGAGQFSLFKMDEGRKCGRGAWREAESIHAL